LSKLLENWNDDHSELGLEIYAGEVGCVLSREPVTSVGIDVAIATHEQEQASIDAGTTQLEVASRCWRSRFSRPAISSKTLAARLMSILS
jgi:hypothetical protein